jgi:glycine cleavage system H lipoate-binding protein
MGQTKSTSAVTEPLVGLVYELLDAHDDTERLVRAKSGEEAWTAHLEYLRSLQRVGRELLAHADQEQLKIRS